VDYINKTFNVYEDTSQTKTECQYISLLTIRQVIHARRSQTHVGSDHHK